MSQHTPGPWKAHVDDGGIWVEPPNPNEPVICDIVLRANAASTLSAVEDEANANLIAAAPEMLEALEASLAYVDIRVFGWLEYEKQVRAAISKAKGGTR